MRDFDLVAVASLAVVGSQLKGEASFLQKSMTCHLLNGVAFLEHMELEFLGR